MYKSEIISYRVTTFYMQYLKVRKLLHKLNQYISTTTRITVLIHQTTYVAPHPEDRNFHIRRRENLRFHKCTTSSLRNRVALFLSIWHECFIAPSIRKCKCQTWLYRHWVVLFCNNKGLDPCYSKENVRPRVATTRRSMIRRKERVKIWAA